MKFRNIFRILSAGIVLSCLASCHNKEAIFPDYEGGITTYFAYQYPVRTIVLGESETFDTSLDNQGKCIIYGTMGGAYKGKDVVVDIEVDNTLVDNLYFSDGSPVKYMPGHYYDLSATQLKYNGTHMGGVEVSLHDDFFADPAAIKNTYVIPVKMTNIVKGADQILTGTPSIEGETPARTNSDMWSVLPKDYTLYAVKYVNKWDGSWLRRGKDVVTGLDAGTYVRHAEYVENDQVTFLETQSLNSVTMPVETSRSYNKYTEGYALKLVNAEAKANAWESQVWYSMVNVPKSDDKPAKRDTLKQGNTYVLKGMVKATSDYQMGIFLQSTDHDEQVMNWNDNGTVKNFSIAATTEWTPFEVRLVVPKLSGAGKDKLSFNKLTFNFGDFAGTIYLDNLSLVTEGVDEANKIYNADFEEDYLVVKELNTGWHSWTNIEKRSDLGEGVTKVDVIVEPLKCNLLLTFDESGKCTVSSLNPEFPASGTGEYIKDGAPLAWGNKDRDLIRLSYNIKFAEYKTFETTDTLVSRSREIKHELFVPTYKE